MSLGAGCRPTPNEGQYSCLPDQPGACPAGWVCLREGSAYRCFSGTNNVCGNLELEAGEQCDGTNFGGFDCADFGQPRGTLLCLDDCTAHCTTCGNGEVELTSEGLGEQCDDGNLVNHDGCSSACTREVPAWETWHSTLLAGRTEHRMVTDEHRQRVVLFGGRSEQGARDDTWVYESWGWRRLTPARWPAARTAPSLTYDAVSHEILLFGGHNTETGVLWSDTWLLVDEEWTRLWPEEAPGPRWRHVAAYHAAAGHTLLFGGSNGAGMLDDVWLFEDSTWRQLDLDVVPPPRQDAALAYDEVRQQLVLFGGVNGNQSLGDTWLWDGERWERAWPVRSPPPRLATDMAWDSARERLVLFGGYSDGTMFRDTWEFDGQDWWSVTPPERPAARADVQLTVHPGGPRIVHMFGGQGGAGDLLGDQWSYSEGHWTPVVVAARPPARSSHTMACVDSRRRAVIFGGIGGDKSLLSDTWEFDGYGWQHKLPASAPPPRRQAGMVWDAARDEVLLFGGVDAAYEPLGDTWRWDGQTWSGVDATDMAPPARAEPAMAYDPAHERVVLFGGAAETWLSDTWVWDGTTWTALTGDPAPPARQGGSLAYDPDTERMVLFGGLRDGVALPDTWVLDGTSWTRLNLSYVLSGRWRAIAASDPVRQRILMTGGYSYPSHDDVWEFDGGAWHELEVFGDRGVRSDAAGCYARWLRRLVVFGGWVSEQPWVVSDEVRLFGWHSNVADEQCNNDIDDDGDGALDCEDADCAEEAACGGPF